MARGDRLRAQRNKPVRPWSASPRRHGGSDGGNASHPAALAGSSGAALALTRELLTMREDTCLTSPIFAGREDFHDK
jgi:hypothetical protein